MKELVFSDDPYKMNWLRDDYVYGDIKGPTELIWQVVKSREDDVVHTKIEITNPGTKPYFTNRESIGIYFPLVDKYDDSEISLTRRCHAHIFCGKQISYICALRMGGEAPHLGMVLTKGSLAGYSIIRDVMKRSNDRGCFVLHPDAMTFAAGETKCIEWTIFPHEGKDDFKEKMKCYQPCFVEVKADRYVIFQGEKNKKKKKKKKKIIYKK